MRILITGGAGFLGQRLALELLQNATLNLDDQHAAPVEQILLTDNTEPPFWHRGLQGHRCVETRFGDIGDAGYVASLFDKPIDAVFHLASIVSGHGEQDFDLALRVNLDGTRYLLQAARNQQQQTRLVFTSSMAAFGGDTMPATVSDQTKQTATTTYGMTKTIGELLINDYSRKGYIDGRTARLPTVIVRPGKPNKAASSFVSGLFREPLAGQDCVIPVDPAMPMAVLGYRSIVSGIIRLAEIPASALGSDRAVGLPAFNVTVQDLMNALINAAGDRPLGNHIVAIDEQITRICGGWPQAADASRALQLGLPIEKRLEDIVRYYISDYLQA